VSRRRTETTVIARTVVRAVVPLVLVTAVALLLQGHNLPGGGFIAGVLTVTAFALVYVIYGREYLEEELVGAAPPPSVTGVSHAAVEYYRAAFAVGLALAAGAGLGAVVVGYPFLTQAVYFLHDLPVYHEMEVATALAFDVGVYLVVVGGLLTILGVMGGE
jgi:multicomponent Na+:H+ antiporter subunit B